MVEEFGRAFSKANKEGKINSIIVIDNIPNITHQQYAGDTILPSESTIKEALNIKTIIQQYLEASRQRINASKLEIFFVNTNPNIEKHICNIMGFKKGNFPCKYLGIELENGNKHNKVWSQILKDYIQKWEDGRING